MKLKNLFNPDFSDKPKTKTKTKTDDDGILSGAPIVEGFQEGLNEFRMMARPITYVKRRMGFVCGICGVIALGSLTWWTFIQDPGTVTSADMTDPSEIAKFAASRGTRPVTNRVYGFFGWLGNRFQPEEEDPTPSINRVPNAYATQEPEG